jgi:hypothetical protein
MKSAILLLGIALLVAGCMGSTPSNPPAPPAQNNAPPQPVNNTPVMSCNDYCITLPHTQCVGDWKISGTYPNCVCTYECAQPSANNTTTTPPPPPQPEPLGTPTNKSVADMLTDNMNALRTQFYKDHSGTFSEKSYTWERVPPNDTSGGMDITMAPATDILFDGKTIDSVRASGFYVFTDASDSSQVIVGANIFQAKSTPLDAYSGTDVYRIGYFPSMIAYNLSDCYTTSKDYEYDPQNNWYVTYKFSCVKAIAK